VDASAPVEASAGPPILGGRAQLGDEVASYLRDLIMSGQLSGEYVRLERVAETLGVSVTPVREALLSLRAEGFVRLEPRRGFLVLPLTGDDVTDLFLAQSQLAGELAARAAIRSDEEVLERLHRSQESLRAAAREGDLARIEEENYLFHREINLAADAPKLTWLLGVVVRYAPRRFYPTIEGWPAASVRDHDSILDAITRKDERAARGGMVEHIVHAGELLVGHLRTSGRLVERTKDVEDITSGT